jgi:multidrug efflux pump subunit AcrA (membrane-fusion protein)
VAGRIASRNVDVGAEVQKGTLLATLDPTDQQNQLRSAQGDLARSGAVDQRPGQRPPPAALFDRGVGAQAQLDIAQTNLKTTQASLEQARSAVSQARTSSATAPAHRPQSRGHRVEGRSRASGDRRPAVVTLAQPDVKEAVIDLPDTLADQFPRRGVSGGRATRPEHQHHRHLREIEPQAKAPPAPVAPG